MLTESDFRDLVSGRRRGIGAATGRFALRLLEVPYSLAVAWRNRRFDRDRKRIHPVSVPVVSVGNITVGGTGKTPMVEWLARWFRSRGVRVTLVSRGYGAAAGSRNDEALELEQKLPDVPHLQNADRVAAAQTAIDEFDCQLILLDDAFQHRRIHRDLDIVLIDALEPFGYGHQLPRGLLRESLASLRRADVIALSRSDLVDSDERSRILDQIGVHAPAATCLEVAHRPQHLLGWHEEPETLVSLNNRRIAAFCGIGNPDGFRRTLESHGCQLVGYRPLPDHYAYQRDDLESLSCWARDTQAEMLVCTHKDLVKIQTDRLGDCPLRAVVVGIEFLSGRESFERRLEPLLPS